jgi:hypothetical protein
MLRTEFHVVRMYAEFGRSCPHRLQSCAGLPYILARERNELCEMC